MKKILFPTDFSKTANNTFVYVLEMAKAFNSEVIVLHVYDLPAISYEGNPMYASGAFEAVEWDNFENLKDQVPYYRKIAKEHHFDTLKMSYILEKGDLITVIKSIHKKEKIDLIVMGTNGASGLIDTFFGSNTGSVISNVSATLLCVPANAKFSPIQNIAFTTRFRNKDHKALQQVVDFAGRINAKIKCLYVKTPDSEGNNDKVEKWRTDFKDAPIQFFIIPDEDVEVTVSDFIVSQEIDILAMLTYKRSFFEELFNQSFAKKLSYKIETPLLVFHENKKKITNIINK